MKYLKTFNELIKESNNIIGNTNDMKGIFTNIFRIFKNKEELSDIFTDEKLSLIATDVYDAFVDARELLQLPEGELQVFAANLGVGGEDDPFSAIVNKMYEDKFKRNFKNDINDIIKYLENYVNTNRQTTRNELTSTGRLIDLSRKYLIELKKIYDNV